MPTSVMLLDSGFVLRIRIYAYIAYFYTRSVYTSLVAHSSFYMPDKMFRQCLGCTDRPTNTFRRCPDVKFETVRRQFSTLTAFIYSACICLYSGGVYIEHRGRCDLSRARFRHENMLNAVHVGRTWKSTSHTGVSQTQNLCNTCVVRRPYNEQSLNLQRTL